MTSKPAEAFCIHRAVVAGYFLCGPALLALAYALGRPVFPAASLTARGVIAYGVAAPVVGALLAMRHRRARFAAYVFLSVSIARALVRGAGLSLPLVTDALVLLYLQTPRMRRVYPRIDPREMRARWRRALDRWTGRSPGR